MPSWISKLGVWEPAPEYNVNPKAPRGKEVYEGKDRAALDQLKEEGVENLGTNLPDADMLRLARGLGFNTVDDYLETMVPGAKKRSEDAYNKAKGITITHADEPKNPAIVLRSGGDNEAPGGKGGRKGGFELPADVPSSKA